MCKEKNETSNEQSGFLEWAQFLEDTKEIRILTLGQIPKKKILKSFLFVYASTFI
jgi:hypothetical protein